MDQSPPRYPVTCEIDGKRYKGNYWIAGKILTVSTGLGGKSREVGSTPAEALAKQLTQEQSPVRRRRHERWLRFKAWLDQLSPPA
jgi:hypothetical protein